MALVSFGSLALASLLLSARALAGRSALERALVASVLWIASAIGVVELLSPFHAIAAWPFTLTSAAVGVLVGASVGRAAWASLGADVRAMQGTLRNVASAPASLAVLGVSAVAVLLPIFAGVLLVPWSWDGLGYHLPLVNDAVSEGTLRWVPSPGWFVNCYPHLVDVFFVAVRISFVDDAYVDLGQLPFVLPAVLSIALLARLGGVASARALPLATLFTAFPIVSLQLASNYVDVAYAGLVLAGLTLAALPTPSRATMLASGLALGLALGSKPSSPPIVLAGLLYLLFRARREERLGEGMLACALTFAIGSWKYVENLARFGNPVYPVRLSLGPISLPGETTAAELATMGLREPYRSMSGLERLATSWLSPWPGVHVYDMRIGGFGPLFTFLLLPLGIAVAVAGWRSRRLRHRLGAVAAPLLVLAVVGLVSPGAYWSRYTIVVASAALVACAALSEIASARWRPLSHVGAAALAAIGLFSAYPGFTFEGPPLFAMLGLPRDEREAIFGLDSHEREWRDARERLGPGEGFGYDDGVQLAGRLMPSDGRGRVVYRGGHDPSADELVTWARDEHLRMVALGEDTGGAAAARERPAYFTETFVCPRADERCAVFEVDLEALAAP